MASEAAAPPVMTVPARPHPDAAPAAADGRRPTMAAAAGTPPVAAAVPPWRAWAVATRPRSLPVAASPVVAGAALGYLQQGRLDGWAAVLVLAAALLMQVVTNLQNDVGFTVRGGERRGTRTGLPRATAQGWLRVEQVRAGIVLAAVVATALGVALTLHRGWPVLAIGSASLLAALAYMGGPRPIAYTPLGELTVFVFFGLVALPGTEWVLTGAIGAASWPAAAALGSLAAAALAVNNHRDRAHDALIGRHTLAVRLGERRSLRVLAVLWLLPFLLLPLVALLARAPAMLLPLVLLPLPRRLWRAVRDGPGGAALNPVVGRSFQLEARFAALLAAGALLTAVWP